MKESKRKKSKGLGDTIEKITEATGIKKAVKFVFGDDCGCDERKEFLNKLFPYRKPNCLTETEYNYLYEWFKHNRTTIHTNEQKELLSIYNRVLNDNKPMTNCNSCWVSYINELKKIYQSYEG